MKVRIVSGETAVEAVIDANQTGWAIREALPLAGTARRWGAEIYFEVPVSVPLVEAEAATLLEKGDLGYWPTGRAFCVFWGPTPASRTEEEIRPASAVNVFGRVTGDAAALEAVADGDPVRVERAGG